MTVLGSSVVWASAAGQQRDWIATRIPHQGLMCLLDNVVLASAQEMVCTSSSHRSPHNPMRVDGMLGAACGIEYAAQAMALHGALIAEIKGTDRSSKGFLVNVRNVSLHVDRLDDLSEDLTVSARCEADNGDHCVYEFKLSAAERVLIQGRAMVMLNASTPTV
ncbi:hydroxymyristoyl-ACP dehydratase [Ottowia thiooxydans]|uniref:Hotdog family 3-hydroxylacyl-ACP dehydratase n=1 Tax=Ottowia thiooxydans TaxID=219182 RepID=A0ABV2Q1M4_9BURK